MMRGMESSSIDTEAGAGFAGLVEASVAMSDDAVTDRFRTLELVRRRLEAEQAMLARVAERRGLPQVDGHRSLKGWIRAHRNCSTGEANRQRRIGRLLDEHRSVGDALTAGHVGVEQVTELARARANRRCGDQLGDVITTLVDHAEHLDFEGLRTLVRRWEALADLDGAQRNDDASHDARTASAVAFPAGVGGGINMRASGGSTAVAAELEAIFTAFVEREFQRDHTERATRHGTNTPTSELPRTDPQRRFDALCEIFRAAAQAETRPDAGDPIIQPTVNLLIDQYSFETILARHGVCPPPEFDLPDLLRRRLETSHGHVVPPDEVLRAALHGVIRRIVVDDRNIPLRAGRTRRLFTGTARRIALLLAGRCGHLGCAIHGEHCDVDHTTEWDDGGSTDIDNAGARCNPQNRWKHRKRLRVHRDHLGRIANQRANGTWMLPVGRRPPHTTIRRNNTTDDSDGDDSDHDGDA